jgi:microcystin-dependent protein
MATIPDNPTPIIDAPIFIPEYWIHTPTITTTNITNITKTTILGQIVMVARTTLPSPDYVWCDGNSYPTSFYPSLFALIGYTYGGSGDNFNVPNLCGKTFVGADATSTLTTTYGGSPVSTGGNKTISINQLAQHSHTLNFSPSPMIQNVYFNNSKNGQLPYIFNPEVPINISGNNFDIVATMGTAGSANDYLPPFFVCNYMIRAI